EAVTDGRSLWHCGNDLFRRLNRIVRAVGAFHGWRGYAIALRDVEHGIVAEHRHAALAGRLARLVHVQPFPANSRASVSALADVAAHFFGLLEREPEWRFVR